METYTNEQIDAMIAALPRLPRQEPEPGDWYAVTGDGRTWVRHFDDLYALTGSEWQELPITADLLALLLTSHGKRLG